jgi:hypothetical protein
MKKRVSRRKETTEFNMLYLLIIIELNDYIEIIE